MNNTFTSLTNEELKNWTQKVKELGLDPEDHLKGYPYRIVTKSLEQYKNLFSIPGNFFSKTGNNILEPSELKKDIEKMSLLRLRGYIIDHIMGKRTIKDEELIKAIEKKVKYFSLDVIASPDILVTAQNPLIISSNSSVTIYGKVTIEPGGYIKITVPCHFQCNTLVKSQGNASNPEYYAYDVLITGIDGIDASNGSPGYNGYNGSPGSDAECDCCGGTVAHDSTPGGDGGPGTPGNDAQSNGGKGGDGPPVLFTITSLQSSITLCNQGGRGGNGGHGGNGGNGGSGGKGGNGRNCAAFNPGGASGGNGGNGNNGGNGSNGGNGGKGGIVTVKYDEAAPPAQIIAANLHAPGGNAGMGGHVGQGGQGGQGGSNGGSQGKPGDNGSAAGQNGQAGQQGDLGTIIINEQPI